VVRRRLLIVAGFVVVAVVVALVFVVAWPDGNHRSAVEVVRNAGVPAGATPGPAP
jgi:hypothetical protein